MESLPALVTFWLVSFDLRPYLHRLTSSSGINPNFGDTAKITNSKLSGVKSVCTKFTGVKSGSEPSKVGEGADGTSCIFGADVVQG